MSEGCAAELFFEVGCEEIPAAFLAPAREALGRLLGEEIAAARLGAPAIATWASPRRLAVSAQGVARRQPDLVTEKLGPPLDRAFDAEGKPTAAALGFLRTCGATLDDLKRIDTARGTRIGVIRTVEGQTAAALLPELLVGLLGRLPFRKTMRWGRSRARFARPIHWICAVLDGQPLPVRFGEPGSAEEVVGSRLSRGHRFLSPGLFEVHSAAQYLEETMRRKVVVDPAERRRRIVASLDEAAAAAGGRIVWDEAILDEVTNLVEWPVPLIGSFGERFLALPRPVLLTSMGKHQRAFALEGEGGALLPKFAVVVATEVRDASVVRAGNEWVLRARLEDARFFFEEDLKRPLADRGPDLERVVFQAKLGSFADKARRLGGLAGRIGEALRFASAARAAAERAAGLCKCDLVTGMVGEFPELQGIMGREYALRSGEPPAVAEAIGEHYEPRSESAAVPRSEAGTALALADKIDSVCGLLAAGLGPTGKGDPFAVRQRALGAIRILLEGPHHLRLSAVVPQALERYGALLPGGGGAEVLEKVLAFWRERLRAFLVERRGLRPDIVEAVLALAPDDLVDAAGRAEAVAAVAGEADFERFFDLAKRVRKIAPFARLARGGAYVYEGLGEVRRELLVHPLEQELHGAYERTRGAVERAVAAGEHAEALRRQRDLIDPVDRFFNKGPRVLDQGNPPLMENRKLLCAHLDRIICAVADLGRISGAAAGGQAGGEA